MCPKKDETAARGYNPALSVLVVLLSRKVTFFHVVSALLYYCNVFTVYYINESELPGFLLLRKMISSHERDIISFTCEYIDFVTFRDEFAMFQC